MPRYSIWAAMVALAALANGQGPCSPAYYNELNEPRRSTGYQTGYPEKPLCDMHLPEGWYRFTNKAGGMMPTTCPDELKCGTVVPIWMNGTHPSVSDGMVLRQACGNFNSGSGNPFPCCEHSLDIAVLNCGSFYVYYLYPTPSCPVAYCAGDVPPCPLGRWSQTNLPPCKDEYPLMKTPPVLSGPNIHNNKSFDFECKIQYSPQDPDQNFEVVWTFEGKEDPAVPTTTLTDPQRIAILDGSHLKGHMNTNVGCKVRSYFTGNQGHKSAFLKSNTYYAGITINPAKLTVTERDFEENITVTSTIPILCYHQSECCIVFKLDVDATTDLSVQTSCDYKLCREDWDPALGQASMEIPVIANQDMVKDGNKQLLLTFDDLFPAGGGPYLSVFEGHTPNQVQIEVKDQKTFHCPLTGDPHIHGFDYSTYHLFKTGDFIAYEVPSRDFKVQIRTWACNRVVACICGVVIKERNDVIRIDECDQAIHGQHTSPTIDVAHKLSDGTVVQRSANGHHIGVYLPSGSEIKLRSTNYYFDLEITTPGIDKGQARGLCGTNDGNKDNDFTHPDGTVSPVCKPGTARCIPDTFEEAWRSAPKDSMFENVPQKVTVVDDVKYCACKDNHHGRPAVNCTTRTNVPSTGSLCRNCPQIHNSLRPAFLHPGWHKTTRDVVYGDTDVPDAPYVQKDLPSVDPNKKWPNAQGVTETEARKMCEDAAQKSQLATTCSSIGTLKEVTIMDCMSDILFGETTEFLEAITASFTSICQSVLSRDPANYVTDLDGNRVMKHEYLEDVCDPGCYEHGHCGQKGKCICDAGWEGEMCHIETGKGPQMDRIRGGPLCDIASRPCRQVFIDVTNINFSDDLICRVQPVDEKGTHVGRPVDTEARFLSAKRIACVIPETVVASQHYKVSASNDGTLFGNELSLHVFDSLCLECTGLSCKPKTSACYIDNVCHKDGEADKAKMSNICDISKDTSAWSTNPAILSFFPTLSGPNVDNLMKCKIFPPSGVTGTFTVGWYIDGVNAKTETLSAGVTEASISGFDLPANGKLTCRMEINGHYSVSGATDLVNIKH